MFLTKISCVLYLPMCTACLIHLIVWWYWVKSADLISPHDAFFLSSPFPVKCKDSSQISRLFLGGIGDHIVSIMTRLWAGRSCSNFSRCKRFLSVSKRPFWLWGLHSLIWSLPRFFPGFKCPGREVDHLRPSSVKVKNEWNCTSPLSCVPSCCGQGQLCHFLPFMF
jgi:hypothetical protein